MIASAAAAISPWRTCSSSHSITRLFTVAIVLPPPHEAADEHHRGCHRRRHHLGQPSRLVALERSLGRVEPDDAADIAQGDDKSVQGDDERDQVEARLERIEAHPFPGRQRSRIILRCSAWPASAWIRYQAPATTNSPLSSSTLMISGLARNA